MSSWGLKGNGHCRERPVRARSGPARPGYHCRMTLRERALELLLVADADEKARRTVALELEQPTGADAVLAEPAGVPGRPERPMLVPHTKLKRGSLATRARHAAQQHAVAHIEVNA